MNDGTDQPFPGWESTGLAPDTRPPIPDWLQPLTQPCLEPNCPHRIVFAFTNAHATTPVDARPSNTGNLRLWLDKGTLRSAVIPAAEREPGELLYLSHFSTCKNPGRFRNRPRSSRPEHPTRRKGPAS
jgi:hypothetical protein